MDLEKGFQKFETRHKGERLSTGLEPYLALEPRSKGPARRSKSWASDPDRFWQVLVLIVIAVVLIVGGVL